MTYRRRSNGPQIEAIPLERIGGKGLGAGPEKKSVASQPHHLITLSCL